MMNKCFGFLLLTFLLATLSACGFHLRGQTQVAPQFHRLYLQTQEPFSPFTQALQQQLKHNHVQLTRSPKKARTTLDIINTHLAQHISSISSTTQSRVYVMNFAVDFALLDNKGHPLHEQKTLHSERRYVLNSNQVNGSENEKHALIHEMQQDVIVQLLHHLTVPPAT